ncbi:hypothetical protein EYF80_022212 [Liparis tanakae]|uniref:Uncharacterized protein n=1 Tax=Liparis tanakae TaxID=230148 RepID=A0A4Z2HNX7_9TELE|nr:hypothetical protein EYF80_022212 [Liparis tanakae]
MTKTAIFCHGKYMSQKDHVRETLAGSGVDLLHEGLEEPTGSRVGHQASSGLDLHLYARQQQQQQQHGSIQSKSSRCLRYYLTAKNTASPANSPSWLELDPVPLPINGELPALAATSGAVY